MRKLISVIICCILSVSFISDYKNGIVNFGQQQNNMVTSISNIETNNVNKEQNDIDYSKKTDKMISVTSTQNKFMEISISDSEYTFQQGDVIEYQVYLFQNAGEIGGIDIYFNSADEHGSNYIRDEKFCDAYGLGGHPSTDISIRALNKWYTRKLITPTSVVGRTANKWCIALGNRRIGGRSKVNYDNFVVRNANGIIVHTIYTNQAEIVPKKIIDTGDTSLAIDIAQRNEGSEMNIAVMESNFGKIEIDTINPAILNLWLRQNDGTLSNKSVLANRINPNISAYSYLVDINHIRYESRYSKAHKVNFITENNELVGLRLINIELRDTNGKAAPITQDWSIKIVDGKLVWSLDMTWLDDFSAISSGMPSLYLADFGGWGTTSPREQAQVTSTLWYEPTKLYSEYSFDYENLYNMGAAADAFMTDDLCQTIIDKDAYAIYKLYTTFDLKSDIALQSNNGYLFRRGGSSVAQTEIGQSLDSKMELTRKKGNSDHVSLTIYPVDNSKTGMQLNIDLPESEKEYEDWAKYYYNAMLNGGVISNNKEFWQGNGTDACNYSGNTVWHAMNLMSGIDADGKLSSNPYSFTEAYKRNLLAILATRHPVTKLTMFGYNGISNGVGEFTDENLDLIIGCGYYYLSTGDEDFLMQIYPRLQEIMEYFINAIETAGAYKGLYKNPSDGPHWYYDAMRYSGYNTYVNTLVYKALSTMSDISKLLNKSTSANEYKQMANTVKKAVNDILWNEHPVVGGARYSDWITTEGVRHEYFTDICQYNAIVYGVASLEQAKKIIKTADDRIAELKANDGYTENASLSNLWELPKGQTDFPWGEYMNGGSFFAQTFYEITARCIAGDSDGAYYRFKKFKELYDRTKFYGTNGCNMKGEMGVGGEAYLADVVTVMSSMMFGFVGIQPGFEGLTVAPSIPTSWTGEVKATIKYLGQEKNIVINDGIATINGEKQLKDYDNVWTQEQYHSDSGVLDTDGLEVLFNFEETYQKYAINSVDNKNSGKYTHAVGFGNQQCFPPVIGKEGKFGKSHYFGKIAGAPNNEQIRIIKSYDFTENEEFTMSAWFKLDKDALDTNPILMGKPNNYFLNIHNRKLAGIAKDDSGKLVVVESSVNVVPDKWTQFTAVYGREKNGFVLYMNGEEVARGDISSLGSFCSPQVFYVGAGQYGNNLFEGYLDDVALFDRRVTENYINDVIMQGLQQKGVNYKGSGEKTFSRNWTSAKKLVLFDYDVSLNGGAINAELLNYDSAGQLLETINLGNLSNGINSKKISSAGNVFSSKVKFTFSSTNEKLSPKLNLFTIKTDAYDSQNEHLRGQIEVDMVDTSVTNFVGFTKDFYVFDVKTSLKEKENVFPLYFSWDKIDKAYEYRVDIATDKDFTDIILQRNTKNAFLLTTQLNSGYHEKLFVRVCVYTDLGLIGNKNVQEINLNKTSLINNITIGNDVILNLPKMPSGYSCDTFVSDNQGFLAYGDFKAEKAGDYNVKYVIRNGEEVVETYEYTITISAQEDTPKKGCNSILVASNYCVLSLLALIILLAIKKSKRTEK